MTHSLKHNFAAEDMSRDCPLFVDYIFSMKENFTFEIRSTLVKNNGEENLFSYAFEFSRLALILVEMCAARACLLVYESDKIGDSLS